MNTFFPNNIWRFLLLLIVCFVIAGPTVLLESVIGGYGMQICLMIVFGVVVTIFYYYAAKKSGHQWLSRSEFKININYREILCGILFAISFVILSWAYRHYVSGKNHAENINAVAVIAIVILGPTIEEWVFRGIFLKSLLTKVSKTSAILQSSIIFGLIHIGNPINPIQIVGAIGLGCYFGYIYTKHGSLVNSIIMHSLTNAIGLMGLYLLYSR